MGAGVGISGSPIPKSMTSMPFAFFSAFFLLMPTNRYGGTFSIRFDRLIPSPSEKCCMAYVTGRLIHG